MEFFSAFVDVVVEVPEEEGSAVVGRMVEKTGEIDDMRCFPL